MMKTVRHKLPNQLDRRLRKWLDIASCFSPHRDVPRPFTSELIDLSFRLRVVAKFFRALQPSVSNTNLLERTWA